MKNEKRDYKFVGVKLDRSLLRRLESEAKKNERNLSEEIRYRLRKSLQERDLTRLNEVK